MNAIILSLNDIMIKTQVQLEEWQYQALKRLSRRESRSIADLVRESVAQLVRRADRRAMRPLDQIAGKYRPRDTDDLKQHDRAWADSVR